MGKESRVSSISHKAPSFVEKAIKNGHSYLEAKREDDDIGGLWRIRDSLYDLTDFIDIHPGGADWLVFTKGTDITEAVEVHHIYPERLLVHLDKYFVRPALSQKNIKLTFDPNGFYNTLKSRVAEKLLTMDTETPIRMSKLMADSLLVATVTLAILSAQFNSIILAAFTSLLYTCVIIAGHNYFHRRDNFRMTYFNLSFMSYRDWRISHSLSHHLYPNSLHDVEVMLFEPVLCWLPSPKIKTWVQRYLSWIYAWIFYVLLFISEFIKKMMMVATQKSTLHLDELLPLAIPFIMYLLTACSLAVAMKCYSIILCGSSLYFSLVGLNAGHHHPEAVHDGDALREGMDWGIYQLDTVIDRKDIHGKHFLSLVHFGDHALHHLFPTLDHGILPELYPILFKTMDDFEAEFYSYPWLKLIRGQFQQLARIEPMTRCSYQRSKYYKMESHK